MKRLRDISLIAILILACTAGTGTQYSGITSMTFQKGVSEGGLYAGSDFTYITNGVASADVDKNYGAATTMLLSGLLATAQNKILGYFDISALPDSAVIVRARLYEYQSGPASSQAPEHVMLFHRIGLAFVEGTANGAAQGGSATWNSRGAANWGTAGMASIGIGAAGGSPVGHWWAPFTGTAGDSTTLNAAFTGGDSISVLSTGDYIAEPAASNYWHAGSNDTRRFGWLVTDVTHMVWLWHIGAVPNNGFVQEIDDAVNTSTFQYESDDAALVHRRPKLIVEYLDPTVITGTTSARGRTVIGTGA